MRIRTARCFKTTMARGETGGNAWTIRGAKLLVRPPASCYKTLLREHFKSILGCAEMFLTAQSQIGQHGRTQRIDMAVSMPARQHVAALRQRMVILIVEILPPKLSISLTGAALICQKEIF